MARAVPQPVGSPPRPLRRRARSQAKNSQAQTQRGNPMNEKSAAKTIGNRTYPAAPQELWELWTTKEGFESWWGRKGFRSVVHKIEAREGGELHYDMLAATPEMIECMDKTGQPRSHKTRGRFAEFKPYQRL